MNKDYTLNAYQDIPKYAEVKVLKTIRKQGYSVYEVLYGGKKYYPLTKDVLAFEEIKVRYDHTKEDFDKWKEIYENTVLALWTVSNYEAINGR